MVGPLPARSTQVPFVQACMAGQSAALVHPTLLVVVAATGLADGSPHAPS
jgi:hypothetical protein